MKKSYFFLLVAMLCFFATSCNKEEMKTIGRFIVSEQGFVDPDSKMHLTWINAGNSHLTYDNNDALNINGHQFTLHNSGGVWTAEEANNEDVSASKFYCIFKTPNLTITGQGPTFNYSTSFSGSIATHNGIILAGSTEDSLLTLKPACAIIRFPASGAAMDYVQVGFRNVNSPTNGTAASSAIPHSGTVTIGADGEPEISGSTFFSAVTSEINGQFLQMVPSDGNAYYYVAVPIPGAGVSTQLVFKWKYSASADVYKYKTAGAVNLQKGKIYTIATTRVSPFNVNGSSKAWFTVGAFSKVRFSPGNLQYSEGSDRFRFANNQYDYIGANNNLIGTGTSNYIDLFGWGTSGYTGDPSYPVNVPYMYMTTLDDGGGTNYYYRGDYISTTNFDWGVYDKGSIYYMNALLPTANWRTLTNAEWKYLLYQRTNATTKWGLATINGMYKGMVLIPDGIQEIGQEGVDWSEPYVGCFNSGTTNGYNTNIYTLDQWGQMENAGAIFLPAAGSRIGQVTNGYNVEGHYWSSTGLSGGSNAYEFTFQNSGGWYVWPDLSDNLDESRFMGYSVRLVVNK